MYTKQSVYREYDVERRYGEDIGETMAEEIALLRNKIKEYEKKLADATWAIYPDETGR